jgi:glycosyltransferase involved in cell wall biosynthesis
MRVAIATVQVPFVRGGAELLAESLCAELLVAGHEAEIVTLPFKWYPARRIGEQMLACRLMDLTESRAGPIDRMIALKFPAYMIAHPNKVVWLLHQHRGAYDLWGTPYSDLTAAPGGGCVRTSIRNADLTILPEARAIYTLSANVSRRLSEHCGIASVPLRHPPPGALSIRAGEYGNYMLFPSRINSVKRQALAIDALSHTRHPVHIAFLGMADTPDYGRQLQRKATESGVGTRVTWLGGVTEEKKLALYSDCRAVIFPPLDEDYGYVTLEAMLAKKAVITCTDSGGPLEFVQDGLTGLVCLPTPEALAAALDRLWDDPALAARLGRGGLERYVEMRIGWESVIQCLLG